MEEGMLWIPPLFPPTLQRGFLILNVYSLYHTKQKGFGWNLKNVLYAQYLENIMDQPGKFKKVSINWFPELAMKLRAGTLLPSVYTLARQQVPASVFPMNNMWMTWTRDLPWIHLRSCVIELPWGINRAWKKEHEVSLHS